MLIEYSTVLSTVLVKRKTEIMSYSMCIFYNDRYFRERNSIDFFENSEYTKLLKIYRKAMPRILPYTPHYILYS